LDLKPKATSMQLTRCSDQGPETLDELYMKISQEDDTSRQRFGRAMLSLLARLRALPDDRQFWGLPSTEAEYRSMDQFHLLSENSSAAPRIVEIIGSDESDYTIEYPVPGHLAPWPGAFIRGWALSEDEAVQMIQMALETSEGWHAAVNRRAWLEDAADQS
jgi:hypothetical protein